MGGKWWDVEGCGDLAQYNGALPVRGWSVGTGALVTCVEQDCAAVI